jgi:transmembrane sensor
MDDKRSLKAQIIAFLNGDASFEEKQELYDWISKSDANARYFAQVRDLWDASLVNPSVIAETEKEWMNFYNRLKLQHSSINEPIIGAKTRKWSAVFFRIAAALILGIFIGGTAFYLHNLKFSPIVYQSLIVPYGSMSELVLSDSSVIYLNAGTQIRYSMNYGKHSREVYLSGEALFDVKHLGKNQPFIVHTNMYDVKVLGTEFNVRAYDTDNTSHTTLQRGRVWISSPTCRNVFLQPGQQFIMDKKSRKAVIRNVDAMVFTSWKDSFSSFTKLTLQDLFVLMEQRYHVTIEVQRRDILNYHYSGTISEEDDIKSILEIVQKTLPIEYEIKNNKIIIR